MSEDRIPDRLEARVWFLMAIALALRNSYPTEAVPELLHHIENRVRLMQEHPRKFRLLPDEVDELDRLFVAFQNFLTTKDSVLALADPVDGPPN